MYIDDFRSRLKGVKANGGQCTAQCPSHEDKHNSLSVAEGDKGIILKCFAGCSPQNIVGAMGLTMADLFPEKNVSITPPIKRANAQSQKIAPSQGLTLASHP